MTAQALTCLTLFPQRSCSDQDSLLLHVAWSASGNRTGQQSQTTRTPQIALSRPWWVRFSPLSTYLVLSLTDRHTRIFVPAEGNALAQILLERGVNGESPIKQRPPRKSTTTRSTPKSARSAKVATKTPRTVSKRARKSTVAPGVCMVEEPKTAKKNKRPSTSTLKTPKARSRKQTKGVDVDADDGGGASLTLARKYVDLNSPLPLPALHTHTPPNICAFILQWHLHRCGRRTSTKFYDTISPAPRHETEIL